jgi:hypothetical protein
VADDPALLDDLADFWDGWGARWRGATSSSSFRGTRICLSIE